MGGRHCWWSRSVLQCRIHVAWVHAPAKERSSLHRTHSAEVSPLVVCSVWVLAVYIPSSVSSQLEVFPLGRFCLRKSKSFDRRQENTLLQVSAVVAATPSLLHRAASPLDFVTHLVSVCAVTRVALMDALLGRKTPRKVDVTHPNTDVISCTVQLVVPRGTRVFFCKQHLLSDNDASSLHHAKTCNHSRVTSSMLARVAEWL